MAPPANNHNSTHTNVCVICLEPLLKANGECNEDDSSQVGSAIGVASCGHPAHCACFESWAEFQSIKSKEGVPCPTCQQETKSFVKIFLRPEQPQPSAGAGSDDEDHDDEDDDKENIEQPLGRRRRKTDKTRPSKTTHKKKAQYYKTRWTGKVEECKALKLEAKNRKRCHHEDLVDLERSQLLNFRLMKQLEQTLKTARFRRNVVGVLSFGFGWFCSRKIRFA